MMRRPISAAALLAVIATAACGGSSPTAPSGATSTTTTGGSSTSLRTSHNAGRDCSSCHSWPVAGTVYKTDGSTPYPGAIVRIRSGNATDGTVVATLTADGSGNFYSSSSVSFGSGLYTTVTGTSGTTRTMAATITSGACNRCHGSSSRLVAD